MKFDWTTEKDEAKGPDVRFRGHVDYGFLDEKGRRVGGIAYIHTFHDLGHWEQETMKEGEVRACIGAARNGSWYGASTRRFTCPSIEAAIKALEQKADQAFKRFRRKYGKKEIT